MPFFITLTFNDFILKSSKLFYNHSLLEFTNL